MRKYETLLLLRPDLSDEQVRAAIERNRERIEGMGGAVDRTDQWGIRELAYPIRKFTRGYYVLLEYMATPDVVWELDRTLKIADDVLRFMTVVQAPVRQRGEARSGKPAQRQPATEGTAGAEGAEAAASAEPAAGAEAPAEPPAPSGQAD